MIEIRMDDVLQTTCFTADQDKAVKEKTMFEWFLEADELFKFYNYPCILAILEEGINKCPEWVEYIKKNQKRYKIELHGREHIRYGELSKEDLFEDLFWSKKRVESEFKTKVSTWYVPFGRKGRNPDTDEVCKTLELIVGIPTEKVDAKKWLFLYKKYKHVPFNHMNFHYWRRDQIKHIKSVLEIITKL